MNRDLVHLCDLTHVSQGYAAELTPYPVACIKAWLLAYSARRDAWRVDLFKHPQRAIDAFLRDRPGIVGFSNYMWNLDIACSIAERIKRIQPETLVVFGGPNFPLENHNREAWLKKRPAVDVYLIGEAEESFTTLVDRWSLERDLRSALRPGISGAHALVDGKLLQSDGISPRVKDLDRIPSPYLEGYLDEFLHEVQLTPLLETNRGCPFTCTFCVDGIDDRTKVHRKSIERFEAELDYVARRYQGKVLTLADLNFGMYSQDIEAARVIAESKKKHDYPYHLQVSTGKNQKARVLECAEILQGSLRLAASVQSLDPEVLKNVRRSNISAEELVEVTHQANALDANSYSEVILGLPGDTKEKHFQTVLQLSDGGVKFIPLYTLMMLEGTQLATDKSRETWKLRSEFRVVPRCFGAYDWAGEEILSAEIEEVCVESSTLPYADYLECRSLALTMGLFYQDRILHELHQFLRFHGILPSQTLRTLHERRMTLGPGIAALFRSFDEATDGELWESVEELERFTKSDASVIARYARGELGNNVLFRHRATAFLELIDEIHDAAFGVAAELLRSRDAEAAERAAPFLAELKTYSRLRKRNLFDLGTEYVQTFTHDFERLLAAGFEGEPALAAEPVEIRFFPAEDQTELLRDQLRTQGSDLNGIAKVISRIPVAKLQRAVAFDSGAERGRDRSTQFARPIAVSPGEFS